MQPGEKIGRYLLEKPLGEGAMSVVFVAKHPQLDPRVALKILRREVSADKQYAARFLEDARVASSLNHPNIVRVTDFDTADGVPFIVMDLVDGWSLEQWLKEKGKLEIRDAARVARDIALGLGAAHASKIVHRDVKPSNVLIDNRTGAAKLTDFGAAKRDRPEDQALTAHGQTIGTPRYMAPEQVHGEPVDPRTDLWALGATLFEMLAGQPAFSATSLPRLYQAIIADDPPRLNSLRPDVPPEMAALVARLLSKSRVARPDSADEVAEALLPFARPNPTSTATTTAQQKTTTKTAAVDVPPPKSGGLPKPALIGGGIAAAAVVAGIAFLLWPERQSPVEVEQPAGKQVMIAGNEAPQPTPEQPTTPPSTNPPTAGSDATSTAPTAPATTPTPPTTTEATPPVVTTAPPPPAPEPVDEAALSMALAGLSCVDASTIVQDGGVVALGGTAADADLAARARELVEQVPGVKSVLGDLTLKPAPGCVAAAKIQEAVANGDGPTVTMNRPDGIYRDGDYAVFTVTMPPDGPDYLYVDLFLDAGSGSAVHLLPDELAPSNKLQPGKSITLGVEEADAREGVRTWKVVPPFGAGYLVMTASEKPVYEGVRGVEEPIADYLDVLIPALTDGAAGKTATRIERIEFRERAP